MLMLTWKYNHSKSRCSILSGVALFNKLSIFSFIDVPLTVEEKKKYESDFKNSSCNCEKCVRYNHFKQYSVMLRTYVENHRAFLGKKTNVFQANKAYRRWKVKKTHAHQFNTEAYSRKQNTWKCLRWAVKCSCKALPRS